MSLTLLHIVTLGDQELYVGADGNWLVKSGDQWGDTPALQAQQSLLWLPLLEYDYGTLQQALVAGLTRADPDQVAYRLVTFPVQDLLRLALTSGGSLYWVDLALEWAAQVDLDQAVRGHVRAVALDATVPQSIRHRAKRLYYTGKV